LAIKLTSLAHKVAHRTPGKKAERKAEMMGMPEYDLYPLGGGNFEVPGRTSKAHVTGLLPAREANG
jgi:hypothetical protein